MKGPDAPPLEARRCDREIFLACLLDEVDLRSAPRLLAAIEDIDFRGARTVRLDLGRVKYADTALVAVVVLLTRSLSRIRSTLSLGPVSPAVDAVLSLHRLAGTPRHRSRRRIAVTQPSTCSVHPNGP